MDLESGLQKGKREERRWTLFCFRSEIIPGLTRCQTGQESVDIYYRHISLCLLSAYSHSVQCSSKHAQREQIRSGQSMQWVPLWDIYSVTVLVLSCLHVCLPRSHNNNFLTLAKLNQVCQSFKSFTPPLKRYLTNERVDRLGLLRAIVQRCRYTMCVLN